MATRHSSRKRPSGRVGRPRPPISSAAPSLPPPPAKSGAAWKRMAVARTDNKPDLDQILGHFCDALAIAETACEALNGLQENGKPIGGAVLTLERGLRELLRAYTELDLAIQRLRPEGAA
jgi:hypothetical protein